MVDVDGVGVGLTTCYDLRFPELFSTLARRGAQLIVVSASWAAGPGKLEQWTLLARARALDSTSYVVAAGQADPGEPLASSAPTGVGGSLVVSPFGDGGGLGGRRPATTGRRARPRAGDESPRDYRGAAQLHSVRSSG